MLSVLLNVCKCASNLALTSSTMAYNNNNLGQYDYGINWTLSATYKAQIWSTYNTTNFVLNNGSALLNYSSNGG